MKLYDQIIEQCNPTIERLIDYIRQEYESNGREYSEYAEKLDRLACTFKLIDSMHKHLLPTDRLMTISSKIRHGQIVAMMSIERDDHSVHSIETEIIYAGGYNIQRRHIRYITKSTLPSNRILFMTDELKALQAKMKSLTKIQKLELENEKFQNRIAKATREMETKKDMTLEEYIETREYPQMYKNILESTYQDVIGPYSKFSDDLIKQMKTEQDWINHQQEVIDELTKSMHTFNVKFPQQEIKTCQNVINRNLKKIEKLKA